MADAESDETFFRDLLQYLGAYAHLQQTIDDAVVGVFLSQRLGGVARFVHDLAIDRIRDSQRPELLQLVATETGSDALLGQYKQVYGRVRKFRNEIAHVARVRHIGDSSVELVSRSVTTPGTPATARTVVTRGALGNRQLECEWLTAQATYVAAVELVKRDNLGVPRRTQTKIGHTPVRLIRPTEDPKSWDRISYQPL